MNKNSALITVTVSIDAPIEKIWEYFTVPHHITQWNNASADWHCPKAENDIRIAGSFSYTMSAKDESFSFDFAGIYTNITTNELIEYTLADGRKVKVIFAIVNNLSNITEIFEAENINSIEIQKIGWQNILDNFKKYTETIIL
jgi:uncharacterized protein YndB with AHSA1/START domain